MTYTSIPYLTRYVIERKINGRAHAYMHQPNIRTEVINLVKRCNDGIPVEVEASYARFLNVEIVTEEEAAALLQQLTNMHAKHLLQTS